MRAEAEGEGQQGMLMVGNVGVNRVRGNCLDFKSIRNLRQMVYQNPGGFEATQKDILSTGTRTRYCPSETDHSRATFLACQLCLMVL